jgi:mannosyltransferase
LTTVDPAEPVPVSRRRPGDRLVAWAWLAPAVLYAVIAGLALDRAPLWQDELATREFAIEPLADIFRATSHVDAVLTPYYVVMHVWGVFGHGPVALRSFSLICGVLTVAVVGRIGNRLWGPVGGVVTGLALAVNSSFVGTGVEARPYAAAILFAAAAAACLVKGTLDPEDSWRWWVVLSMWACLAVLMQLFAVLVLISFAVPVLVRDRGRLARFGLACVPPLVIAATLAGLGHGQDAQIAFITRPHPRALQSVLSGQIAETGRGLLVVLAVVVVVIGQARRRVVDAWWLMAFGLLVAPVVVLYLVSLVTTPILAERYTLTPPVGAALLLGAAATDLTELLPRERTAGRGRTAAAVGACLVVLAFSVAGVKDIVSQRVRGQDDFPSVTRALAAALRPGDELSVFQPYGAGGFAEGVAYYAGDRDFERAIEAELPHASQIVFRRLVVTTSPVETSGFSRPPAAATLWVLEPVDTTAIAAHAASYAQSTIPAREDCRPTGSSAGPATVVSGDIAVVHLSCVA